MLLELSTINKSFLLWRPLIKLRFGLYLNKYFSINSISAATYVGRNHFSYLIIMSFLKQDSMSCMIRRHMYHFPVLRKNFQILHFFEARG